jgi:hypothetical protein
MIKFPVAGSLSWKLLWWMMLLLLLLLLVTSCTGQEEDAAAAVVSSSMSRPVEPDVEPVDYTHDGYALQGFMATPPSNNASTADNNPVPAVIIIP